MATPATNNPTPQPAPRQFPFSPLTGIILVAAIYFGGIMLGQFLVGLYAGIRFDSTKAANDWLAHAASAQFIFTLCVEALTLVALIAVLRSAKARLSDIGLLRFRLRDAGYALLSYPAYFVFNAVLLLGAAALFHFNINQQQQTGFEGANSTTDLVLTFVSLVLLPPIVEEVVMRGFLFSSLKRGTTVVKAAIVTSIIFAAAHLQFGSGAPLLWSAAIDTFVLSLVLCYLRQKTGSLWAGICLHMLKNGLAFIALFVFTGKPN